MTATDPTIICCPVCESHGAVLHHDIRASLLYCCSNCLHEWQIDPAEKPPEAEPAMSGSPRTATALYGDSRCHVCK